MPNSSLNSNKSRRLPSARSARSTSTPSPVVAPAVPDGRCQHLRADGKRCASANYPGHTSLCHHHLNREMRGIAGGNLIAADILSAVGNFQSASAINIVLGKLFIHQITGHISRQDAISLAYTCQLLLQTLPALKAELHDSGYVKYWREETNRILAGPSDLDELTDASLLPNGCDPLHPPIRTPAPSPQTPAPVAPAPPTATFSRTAPSVAAAPVSTQNSPPAVSQTEVTPQLQTCSLSPSGMSADSPLGTRGPEGSENGSS